MTDNLVKEMQHHEDSERGKTMECNIQNNNLVSQNEKEDRHVAIFLIAVYFLGPLILVSMS